MLDNLLPNHIAAYLIVFAVSLYALMRGADWLIEGASSLAKRLNISDLVVGLTIVAFGTSLPELVVSVQAALAGSSALAYANVLGSNIANTLLVLGAASLVMPITASAAVQKDVKFYGIMVVGFCILVYVGGSNIENPFLFDSKIARWGGLCLLGYFALFMIRILRTDKSALASEAGDEVVISLSKATALITIGLILTIGGGEFTVLSAIKIAGDLGVSETTIGLTIVAIGTSLPELVASLSMASKGKSSMIVGNIIGSNIMNLTLVLGTAVTLSPVSLTHFESFDMIFHSLVGLIFLVLMLRKTTGSHLNRRTGGVFVLLYLGYMGFVGIR